MDNIEAKRLRDEAGQLYEQAKAIMTEFQGKEMPKEKSDQVDKLLDDVEAKTEAARKIEEKASRDARLAQNEKYFNDPATRKEAFREAGAKGGGEVKVKWGDRELTEDEVAEIKAMAPFPHFMKSASPEYASAMRAYMRRGVGGLTNDQLKALSAGDATAGGYLQQDTYINAFITKQREVSAMRRIANVLPPVPSGSAIAPAEDSFLSDAAWTSEIATGSEDTVAPFGQRRLTPHPLAKRVKVSNTLLRNPLFDVEVFVRDRLAYKHGISGEDAYINGSGAQQPKGLLSFVGATNGIPAWTTATSLQVYGNDIINWVYKLPQGYTGRARILCNRSFLRKIRTLETPKSGTAFTNYLWQPGLAGGQPNTILDIPYEISDRYPTGLDTGDAWTASSIVAVIGDFNYYWIADALQMSIQRLVELYAETNQTGFIGRMETDGMVVLGEAFYALKVKP